MGDHAAGPSGASGFSYTGTELDALREAHNYYRAILAHFAKSLGTQVIEVGAGIGTFSHYLLGGTNISDLILVEPADDNIPSLRRQFAQDARVRIVHGYLEDLAVSITARSVVAVNVLEHVSDDVAFLRAAHETLAPQGSICLFVPALPRLYGTLDRAFGHVRRYTKEDLSAKLHRAGFHLTSLVYFNVPGVFSWFVAGRICRWTTLRSRDIQLYDRWVMPWVARVEQRFEPPIGQSIVAVARKG